MYSVWTTSTTQCGPASSQLYGGRIPKQSCEIEIATVRKAGVGVFEQSFFLQMSILTVAVRLTVKRSNLVINY